MRAVRKIESAGAGFQLADQRLDLATVAADVGVVLRPPGQGHADALDLPLNFTNIIALPLLFGVGVAFNIYFVLAWRAGETAMLQSSLMRAVVFSAMTTATAFGALWLSSHPGTASMGRLLMISLGWELLVTLLFRPALLARPSPRPARRQMVRATT